MLSDSWREWKTQVAGAVRRVFGPLFDEDLAEKWGYDALVLFLGGTLVTATAGLGWFLAYLVWILFIPFAAILLARSLAERDRCVELTDELLEEWFESDAFENVTASGACFEDYLRFVFREFSGKEWCSAGELTVLLPPSWKGVVFFKHYGGKDGSLDFKDGYYDPEVWEGKLVAGPNSMGWSVPDKEGEDE